MPNERTVCDWKFFCWYQISLERLHHARVLMLLTVSCAQRHAKTSWGKTCAQDHFWKIFGKITRVMIRAIFWDPKSLPRKTLAWTMCLRGSNLLLMMLLHRNTGFWSWILRKAELRWRSCASDFQMKNDWSSEPCHTKGCDEIGILLRKCKETQSGQKLCDKGWRETDTIYLSLTKPWWWAWVCYRVRRRVIRSPRTYYGALGASQAREPVVLRERMASDVSFCMQ